jgi:hypothetical protein
MGWKKRSMASERESGECSAQATFMLDSTSELLQNRVWLERNMNKFG